MLPEWIAGCLGGWLVQKLGDFARDKDCEKAILQALDKAIKKAHCQFSVKYPNFSSSLFDQTFLENRIAPELLKYLTRTGRPDPAAIATAYREQYESTIPDTLNNAVSDFLHFVVEAMKEEIPLQEIIDRRQIEETSSKVTALHDALLSPESDWPALERASHEAAERILLDIGGEIELPFFEDFYRIAKILNGENSLVILGNSGSGKSSIVRRLAASPGRFDRYVWLNSEVLNQPTISEVGRILGLRHSLTDILLTNTAKRPLLILDAIESLSDSGVSNAARTIGTLRQNGSKVWRILITTQPEGWEDLAFRLQRAGVQLDCFSVIQIEGPSTDDVKFVLRSMPTLVPIAFRGNLPTILNNLKLLDHLARQTKLRPIDDSISWVGFSQVVDWIWEGWTGGGADKYARGEVLKSLGKSEAEGLRRGLSLSCIDSAQLVMLPALKNEAKVLEIRDEKIFFYHDLIADWARYRVLVGEEDFLPTYIRKLSTNPKWNEAIRIAGQRTLDRNDETGTKWIAIVSQLSDGSPEGEAARDLFLDAATLSTNAGNHLEKLWPHLIAEKAQLLDRLLKRFLHVATVPDKRIISLTTRDEKSRRQLAGLIRLPVWNHWWPVLAWICKRKSELIQLVPETLASLCQVWLKNTRAPEEGQQAFWFRREMAEIVLALARELQARNEEGGYNPEAEKTTYEALLMAAFDFPDEVGQISLELSCRRDYSPFILERREAYLQAQARRQEELERNPEYRKRWEERAPLFHSPIPRGPLRDPWPDGPTNHPNRQFQKIALAEFSLVPLIIRHPEIAAELILSLCIEPPKHEMDDHYNFSSSEDWCGLQHDHDGTPAMYSEGPFHIFLLIKPDCALDMIIKLVNFATERFCNYMKRNDRNEVFEITVPLPSGDATWLGDKRIYGFFRSETFNTKLLSSALMAVEKWLYDQIDKDENIDKWIEQILQQSRSVAFLGLLAEIGKKKSSIFEGKLLPLFGVWQIFQWDQARLIGESDLWRFSMSNWVPHGEEKFNQVKQWHTLPHRKEDIQKIATLLFFNNQTVRDFFNTMYDKWTLNESTRNQTKYIAERFNIKNYSLVKNEDAQRIDVNFSWPDYMKEETELALRQSEYGMLLLSFPFRCRQILDGELNLPNESIDEFWSQIQTIATMPKHDFEVERPSQRTDAICGGIAVFFALHREWLESNPENEEWCLNYIFQTLSNPPMFGELDREDAIGNSSWDTFAGETAVRLLAENQQNDYFREAVALGVLTFHEEATRATLSCAFELRHRLGSEFTRILNLSLLWSTLRHLRPENQRKENMQRWLRWVERLIQRYIECTIPIEILPIKRLKHAGKRLYALAWHKRQREGKNEYEPGELYWNPGINGPLLQKSLSWLERAELNDPYLPERLAGDLALELLEYSLACAKPKSKNLERYGKSDIPDKMDNWVFDILCRFISKESVGTASRYWHHIFDAGPYLHNWPSFFLMSWFATGLKTSCNLNEFSTHWGAMIDYVLQHEEWNNELAPDFYELHEVRRKLMCIDGFSVRILENNEFGVVIDSLAPRYDLWRQHYLKGENSIAGFCRFLKYPAAKNLRLRGLLWVKEAIENEKHYSSIYKHMENALMNFISELWTEHRYDIQSDSTLKNAFLYILTWLAQGQNASALELQDEFARSS